MSTGTTNSGTPLLPGTEAIRTHDGPAGQEVLKKSHGAGSKDVTRHVKEDKIVRCEGCRAQCSTLKPDSSKSVTACQGKKSQPVKASKCCLLTFLGRVRSKTLQISRVGSGRAKVRTKITGRVRSGRVGSRGEKKLTRRARPRAKNGWIAGQASTNSD